MRRSLPGGCEQLAKLATARRLLTCYSTKKGRRLAGIGSISPPVLPEVDSPGGVVLGVAEARLVSTSVEILLTKPGISSTVMGLAPDAVASSSDMVIVDSIYFKTSN